MKIRNSGGEGESAHPDMTPMIDVVFQLLIFFMLTLRISSPEGDFNINMPIAAPSTKQSDEPLTPAIKVRLIAGSNGKLASLRINNIDLGNGPQAFDRLNHKILQLLGNPKNPATDEMEVELDPDYNLSYRYLIQAMAAVRGKLDEDTGRIISYIEKIKFAAPRRPQ